MELCGSLLTTSSAAGLLYLHIWDYQLMGGGRGQSKRGDETSVRRKRGGGQRTSISIHALYKNRTTIEQAHLLQQYRQTPELATSRYSKHLSVRRTSLHSNSSSSTQRQSQPTLRHSTQRPAWHFHQSNMDSMETQRNYQDSTHAEFRGGVFHGPINFGSGR